MGIIARPQLGAQVVHIIASLRHTEFSYSFQEATRQLAGEFTHEKAKASDKPTYVDPAMRRDLLQPTIRLV